MGEAKNRLEALGSTRRLRLDRLDLVTLVNFLTLPDTQGGKALPSGDRIKRRAINNAFDDFGALELWRVARKNLGPEQTEAISKEIPELTVKEVEVESIRTIQDLLQKALDSRGTVGDALNFGEFEDMLEDALAGTFDAGELTAVPAATDQVPAAAPQ